MSNATPEPQLPVLRPLAIWNPKRGTWESPHLDLFGQRVPCSATWWTSGMTRNGSVYPLPVSAHPTLDTASLSSPSALFRTPLASDAARGGESLQQVKARRGTIALSHQIIDLALHGPNGYPQPKEPEGLWNLIGQLFDAGDVLLPLSPDGSRSSGGLRQRPHS